MMPGSMKTPAAGMPNFLKRFVYYQQVCIYSFRLEDKAASFQPRIPLSVQKLSPGRAKSLHDDPRMDLDGYPWETLEDKLSSRAWHLLTAEHEGRCVGYIFYSTREMSVTGSKKVDFVMPEHAGYPFKLFVDPSYRGLCIGKYLEQAVNSGLLSDNCAVAFRATNSTNGIQLHNYAKLSGAFVGSLSFVRTRVFNTVIISEGIRRAGLHIKKTR